MGDRTSQEKTVPPQTVADDQTLQESLLARAVGLKKIALNSCNLSCCIIILNCCKSFILHLYVEVVCAVKKIHAYVPCVKSEGEMGGLGSGFMIGLW